MSTNNFCFTLVLVFSQDCFDEGLECRYVVEDIIKVHATEWHNDLLQVTLHLSHILLTAFLKEVIMGRPEWANEKWPNFIDENNVWHYMPDLVERGSVRKFLHPSEGGSPHEHRLHQSHHQTEKIVICSRYLSYWVFACAAVSFVRILFSCLKQSSSCNDAGILWAKLECNFMQTWLMTNGLPLQSAGSSAATNSLNSMKDLGLIGLPLLSPLVWITLTSFILSFPFPHPEALFMIKAAEWIW